MKKIKKQTLSIFLKSNQRLLLVSISAFVNWRCIGTVRDCKSGNIIISVKYLINTLKLTKKWTVF